MNSSLDQKPLDGFETRLLAALREEVAGRAPAPARRRTRRRWTVAAAGAAAATVIGGGYLLQPAAAYAVDEQSDGDVVVTIRSLEDADGLERALEAKGVEAEVDYDPTPVEIEPPGPGAGPLGSEAGGEGGPSRHAESEDGGEAPAPGPGDLPGNACAMAVEQGGEGMTFRLAAGIVDSDAVLHITTSGTVDGWSGIAVRWDGDVC